MVQTRQFLFIISLILLAFSCTLAQEKYGQIQGVVKDSSTTDPLFGANIFLKGTGSGAASDIDGKYKISQVPAGSYTLVVQYIGYRGKEFSVNVKAGVTEKLNIILVSQAVEGKEVVVTAQALGQKSAINQQLTSSSITNVVSSEKIHQLPDDNAATALSRLPGVSLMNGDQVVIRGVEAKLNQVLINGIELPSTDMNNRSTNLGFISSNMLSGIEVIKAITPDMDANTAGGVVNLRLREAPTGLHFDLLAQGNYNQSDRAGDNYKFWGSVSNRFLDDKLGVFLQANMDRSDGGNQRAWLDQDLDASGSSKYGDGTYLTSTAHLAYEQSITKTSGASLLLDYKLPNGKIALQNTYSGSYIDQRNNNNTIEFGNNDIYYTNDRNLYGKDLWINSLQAENSFGDFKVELSLSHSSTEQYTRIAYTGIQDEFINQTKDIAPWGYDSKGDAITYSGQAARRTLTLQKVYSIYDNLQQSDLDAATYGGQVATFSNQFYQHLYNSTIDVSKPVNFSNDLTAIFKAGGKFVETTRKNNYDKWFGHGEGDIYNKYVENYFPGVVTNSANKLRLKDIQDNDFARGKNFLEDEYSFKKGFQGVINPDIYDNWITTDMKGWTSPLKQDDSWKDDWTGTEKFSSAYIMGTFNILQDFTLISGLRYESYNMNYHAAFTFVTHSVYGYAVTSINGSINDSTNPTSIYHNVPSSWYNVDRTDNNFFPNAQLKYKVNGWSDIRLAYTTGIARPDYAAIIPKIAVFADSYQFGNPNLKPAKARNFDVVASFYNNEIGLFTINAYYKRLTDVMYTTDIYYGNIAKYAPEVAIPDSAFFQNRFNYTAVNQYKINVSLNNPNAGYIRGVEVDWQTSFWYLPFPFNSLVLDINYTKSGSNMAYRIIRNDPVKTKLPSGKYVYSYTTTDTVFVSRLLQQANDVVNAAIGIDYKGFSGRISMSMTGNVITNIGSRPEEASYTGDIYRWDFTVKQNLPLDGLSIALNGTNIFHNPIRTYRNYRMSPELAITKNQQSVLYGITTYQVNLRYSF
jgi:TonB-dependent receptor